MQNFEAVVFDMDGVIFDSERLVLECWDEVARKYGIENMEPVCLKCTGLTAAASRDVMKAHYGQDFPYDEYKKEMSDIFHSRYDGGRLPLKPGVIELLTFLKEHGKKIALASSTRRVVVQAELADAGIIDFFDAIICGDMVEHSKPAPDIFLKACECLKVSPELAYGIEDSHNGIRSSQAAGMRPIMVIDHNPPSEEAEKVCYKVYNNLSFLKDLIKNENKI